MSNECVHFNIQRERFRKEIRSITNTNEELQVMEKAIMTIYFALNKNWKDNQIRELVKKMKNFIKTRKSVIKNVIEIDEEAKRIEKITKEEKREVEKNK